MSWIALTLFYGIVKGLREIVKKKALTKSTVMEVLFFYSLIGFVILLPDIGEVGILPAKETALIALKSFVIFVAWLCGFYALKEIAVSLYGLLDLSRVAFSVLLGVAVLHESIGSAQLAGILLVALGLLALRFEDRFTAVLHGKDEAAAVAERPPAAGGKKARLFVLLAFLSAFLNAVSGTMDKLLTKSVSSANLQFWYMLFLLIMYAAYILIGRVRIDIKQTVKNYWIWILSILFILADRALFMANEISASRVSVMTLLKQAGCIVTILGGWLVFKEKGILYKLCCAVLVLAGIILGAK